MRLSARPAGGHAGCAARRSRVGRPVADRYDGRGRDRRRGDGPPHRPKSRRCSWSPRWRGRSSYGTRRWDSRSTTTTRLRRSAGSARATTCATICKLDATQHVVFPGPVNALFHNIFEHAAHHVDPLIPLYNLPAAQDALRDLFGGEAGRATRWTPPAFFGTVRRCKLYDYDAGCWTDFHGVRTSPPADERTRATLQAVVTAAPGAGT
ncbi:MAG TPA: hypothetical protein VIW69_09680, partial [Candidatus Elarobacter sp.]